MYVQNLTPLVADVFCTTDARGAEVAVAVVKGTWVPAPTASPGPSARLVLADVQAPIVSAPAYRGEPGASSLVRDTDLVPEKPGTDCLLIGRAWGAGARETHVRFAVVSRGQTVAEARAVVFGPRQWQTTFGVASVVGPLPFEHVELVWEQAFGGADATPDGPDESLAENPVGTGFRARASRAPVDGSWLPSVEHPDDRLSGPNGRIRPVGFGPIAPGWAPRRGYAGTFDDDWRRTRAPLAPADFEAQFYQSAPPGLVAVPHLVGGEQVVVEGCSAQPWRVTLPHGQVHAALVSGLRADHQDAVLDTVVVDADAGTVETVWRASFDIHGRVDHVDGIRVQAQDL